MAQKKPTRAETKKAQKSARREAMRAGRRGQMSPDEVARRTTTGRSGGIFRRLVG